MGCLEGARGGGGAGCQRCVCMSTLESELLRSAMVVVSEGVVGLGVKERQGVKGKGKGKEGYERECGWSEYRHGSTSADRTQADTNARVRELFSAAGPSLFSLLQ